MVTKMVEDRNNYPTKQKNVNARKVGNVIIFDIETFGCKNTKSLPFDIGGIVFDNKTKTIKKTFSYVIKKFFNNEFIMNFTEFTYSKYNKQYKPNLQDFTLLSVREIANRLDKMIKKYNIKYLIAHNGQFDYSKMQELFDTFGIKNPLAKLDIIDTQTMAHFTICNSKDYESFCINNNLLTPSGRIPYNVNAIGKYLMQDTSFEESHTGLKDCKIELDIFQKAQDKKAIFPINVKPHWKNQKKVA